MKRTEPVKIGDYIKDFFENKRLEQGASEGRVKEIWAEIVGKYVAEATEDVYIRGGVIYAHIKSPSARADLVTRRVFILREINKMLDKNSAIRNIRLM